MGDSDHILIVQSAIKEKETTKLINLKKKKKVFFLNGKLILILTTLIPCFSALNKKTTRVEMMTEARGAPAETQNSFGLFMLCINTSIVYQ
jgi:predicted ribosome-associated RNA-binding protein Tma20